MRGFFEIIKGVSGKCKHKSAQITNQAGDFRIQSGKVDQPVEYGIVKHCRQNTDNCIKHKIVQPGKTQADAIVQIVKNIPNRANILFHYIINTVSVTIVICLI